MPLRRLFVAWLGVAVLIAGALGFYFLPRSVPHTEPPEGLGRMDSQLRSFVLEKARWMAAQPRDAARHADLGLVYSANGLWVDAANAYSNALTLGSRDPLVWQYRGVALARMARFEAAVESFRQAVAQRPELASVHWHWGQLLLQTGRMTEAAAAFQRVIQADSQEWRGYVGLGQALLQQGRKVEALAPLERAVKLAPRARAAHAVLARALMEVGDRDRAGWEMALGKGADVSPPADAWTDRMRSYQKTVPDQMELAGELEAVGRPRDAAALLAEVARHHSRNPVVLNRLAMALNQAENPAEGEFYARQALAVDPDYLAAVVTLSFSLIALGRHSEGLAAAERAERLSPEIIQPRLARANALLALERDEEAAAALRAALTLEPNNADVLVELGDVTWRNLGKPAEARALFSQASSCEPALVRPVERLIEWHWEQGERGVSANWLRKLEKLEGPTPAVLEWQQRMRSAEGQP